MVLGGGKADADKLILRGDNGLQVVLDVVIGAQIDANLIRTDGSLEGRPLAVTAVAIVALNAGAIVEAGRGEALPDAALADAVEALLGVLDQLHLTTVDDEGSHAAEEALSVLRCRTNYKVRRQVQGNCVVSVLAVFICEATVYREKLLENITSKH